MIAKSLTSGRYSPSSPKTLESPKTALDIALDNLSDFISKWGTIAAAVTFAVLTGAGIAKVGFSNYFGGNILEVIQKIAQNFSVALTIIVAAVPEGLPLIVKLVTKQNVKTMEKFNILAKNPGKIPELAYVDIICTDKTGTLTTGVMTPKKIIDGFADEVKTSSELWNEIVANICLNNSAVFDGSGEITGGNSIDRAVLTLVNTDEYQRSVIYPMVATGALLASVQILIVNIIMDSLNSLSFGGEPPKEEYMLERPIKKGSGLFIRGAKKRIAISTTAFITLYGIITFSPVANMFASDIKSMTARFALLCFMAVFNGFNIRTEHVNLFKGIGKNKLFSYIAIGIFAMTVILCDFAGSLIKVTALNPNQWIIIIALAFMVIPIDLIRKIVDNRH